MMMIGEWQKKREGKNLHSRDLESARDCFVNSRGGNYCIRGERL
jgi:hypothetical protein